MGIYKGKNLDFFGDAINMLLVNSNYTEIEDIDCISLRNASFINDAKNSSWFNTGVNILEAIKNLEKALDADGLFDVRKVYKKEFDIDKIMNENRPFVFGPISKRNLLKKIDANYFDGERNYIYCFFNKGEIFIHEPDGAPYLIVDAKDFLKMFEKKEYLFQIYVNKNIKLTPIKRMYILEKWLKKREESKLLCNDVSNYDYSEMNNLKTSSEISFGFAIKNYLIQMSKIFSFIGKKSDLGCLMEAFYRYSSEISDLLFNKQYMQIKKVICSMDEYLTMRIMEELR